MGGAIGRGYRSYHPFFQLAQLVKDSRQEDPRLPHCQREIRRCMEMGNLRSLCCRYGVGKGGPAAWLRFLDGGSLRIGMSVFGDLLLLLAASSASGSCGRGGASGFVSCCRSSSGYFSSKVVGSRLQEVGGQERKPRVSHHCRDETWSG